MIERRKVEIVGGTFAICFWLFFIMLRLGQIGYKITKLCKILEEPIQIVVVDANEKEGD